jgi:hypothetical protein
MANATVGKLPLRSPLPSIYLRGLRAFRVVLKALMPEANWPKIMLFRRSFDAMELSTTRTFQAGDSPKEAIPYSSEALRQDVQRVRDAWADCQATRDRSTIYGYLTAVLGRGALRRTAD